MRILENGVYRDATKEEIESNAGAPEIEAEITFALRIEALEAAILELAEVVLNG